MYISTRHFTKFRAKHCNVLMTMVTARKGPKRKENDPNVVSRLCGTSLTVKYDSSAFKSAKAPLQKSNWF